MFTSYERGLLSRKMGFLVTIMPDCDPGLWLTCRGHQGGKLGGIGGGKGEVLALKSTRTSSNSFIAQNIEKDCVVQKEREKKTYMNCHVYLSKSTITMLKCKRVEACAVCRTNY